MAKTSTNPVSFKSAASLVGKKNYIVYISARGVVTIASAATHAIMGVVKNAPQAGAGQNVEVNLPFGNETFKVICGGSVSLGNKLTSDGNGKAVATTSAGNYTIGVAMQDGDTGDIIEVMPHWEKHA